MHYLGIDLGGTNVAAAVVDGNGTILGKASLPTPRGVPAEQVADQKIKREKDDLVLRLKPTCDIAASLGKEKRPDQLLVGFALETCDEVSHAQDKLARKNFDFIVLNSLNDKGAGFRCDTNKITIIDRTEAVSYPLKRKQEVAEDIVDKLSSLFHS